MEPARGGQLALFLGVLTHGGRGGDGGGRAALVFAQSEGQHEVADVFAIEGESARQGAVGGGQSSGERGGELVGVDFTKQVVESGVARGAAEGAEEEIGAVFAGEPLVRPHGCQPAASRHVPSNCSMSVSVSANWDR